jgi:hypothetical protein
MMAFLLESPVSPGSGALSESTISQKTHRRRAYRLGDRRRPFSDGLLSQVLKCVLDILHEACFGAVIPGPARAKDAVLRPNPPDPVAHQIV